MYVSKYAFVYIYTYHTHSPPITITIAQDIRVAFNPLAKVCFYFLFIYLFFIHIPGETRRVRTTAYDIGVSFNPLPKRVLTVTENIVHDASNREEIHGFRAPVFEEQLGRPPSRCTS